MKRATIASSVGLLAALLCLAAPASAEEGSGNPEFDALVAQCVEHYQAQNYDPAVECFERAFAMQPEPELMYNIARVHERAVHREQAVAAYQRFLALPNTTAQLRARAATSLEALETEMAAMDRAEMRAAYGDGGEPGDGGTPATPQESNVAQVVGWVMVGLGGAAIVTGAVLGGLALSEQTATEEANNPDDQTLHFDRGENFALAADVLFGVGGAFAVGGIIALVVHAIRNRPEEEQPDDAAEGADGAAEEPEPEEAVSLTWTPLMLGDGGLGLSLGGRF